ncbi:hypothetical protein CVT24_007906 [Panaeolus cyanescens]|uniref:G-protein coupled receptors family 1 profile domain-containing protein n=1 Tax=Panaeolus cyanescens TaxID=181874 RepID=A0A409W090_9AGAR|nr:hypothetical protein CVT24_007906 [Panaeolus cyanescens]
MSGTIDDPSSWQPAGETSLDLLNEAVNLIASTTLNGLAYGVVLTLYCICIYTLVLQFIEGSRRRHIIFSGIYITVMFACGTVYCAANARLTQLAYVNFRNFPGGPAVYALYEFNTPISIAGATAFMMTTWMNDALLIWRLWVLYIGSRFSIPVVGFAVLTYLATFAMGLVTLVESLLPNQSLWSAISVKFAMSYYAMTVAYTVLITALMVTRILVARRSFIKATGQKKHGGQYLSIVAMIIESSALYTVWGIIFLGLYIVNHPIQYVFLGTLSEVQIIAPLLIMYRVAIGKAWTAKTTQTLTSPGIEFANRTGTQDSSRSTATIETSAARSTFNKIHLSPAERSRAEDGDSVHYKESATELA